MNLLILCTRIKAFKIKVEGKKLCRLVNKEVFDVLKNSEKEMYSLLVGPRMQMAFGIGIKSQQRVTLINKLKRSVIQSQKFLLVKASSSSNEPP